MDARQMLAKLDGYGGIIPFNSEELEVTLRALRLLAAAEGGEGTPETDAELATHKVIMENGGYCGTEPWSGLVTGRFARSLETQRNGLAARVRELDEDAARLDWCQANHFAPRATLITTSGDTSPKVWINDQPRLGYMGRSLREAIDAARSK